MPSKNSIKSYSENSYYHIYNRGVEKRKIFQDEQDYKVFLSYLKTYLEPAKKPQAEKIVISGRNPFQAIKRPLNNFNQEIDLITYCLMPNHFHLLIYQKPEKAIEFFMRSLGTKYSHYFNRKYDRIGYLFQGTYKAVLIQNDEYLLHLSRYIHLNPFKESPLSKDWTYSSYHDYLGYRKTNWVRTEKILDYFGTAQRVFMKEILSYQSFVEDYQIDSQKVLGTLSID